MTKILSLLSFLFVSAITVKSQTVCGTVNEGGTLTLTAPAGKVFTSVAFASYGTPNGSCGSYTTSSCHASNSSAIVLSYISGQNSASIPATNAVFTDPCSGTVKRLYVEAIYASSLPLRLIEFSGTLQDDAALLTWQTADETDCSHFDVEMSPDGSSFTKVARLKANNTAGNHTYSLKDFSSLTNNQFVYYRLKSVDLNGSFTYSDIIKLSGTKNQVLLTVLPNPTAGRIYVSGLKQSGTYHVKIADVTGKVVSQQQVTRLQNEINLDGFVTGAYIITIQNSTEVYSLKVMKQ